MNKLVLLAILAFLQLSLAQDGSTAQADIDQKTTDIINFIDQATETYTGEVLLGYNREIVHIDIDNGEVDNVERFYYDAPVAPVNVIAWEVEGEYVYVVADIDDPETLIIESQSGQTIGQESFNEWFGNRTGIPANETAPFLQAAVQSVVEDAWNSNDINNITTANRNNSLRKAITAGLEAINADQNDLAVNNTP